MPSPVLLLLNRPSLEANAHEPGGFAHVIVDPGSDRVSVLDLGVTRGDGVFETIGVVNGHAQALEPHLARFARSAAMLDLPAPDVDTWRNVIRAAIGQHDAVEEATVKAILTRGVEGSGVPTGWVYTEPSGDFRSVREHGIRVVTLDRGYPSDVQHTAPWLLQGAKTLSYAVNRAALREAERRDADDVVFTSSDGYLLEGPTSTLVLRVGGHLSTPRTEFGILAGTTQASVFAFGEARGMSTGFDTLTTDDLIAADAAWLVSSVRLAAPVRAVNGVERAVDGELTRDINEHLLTRVD